MLAGIPVSIKDLFDESSVTTLAGSKVLVGTPPATRDCPAALNGLVGFKPTARRVPLEGVVPLSFTLDSAGPIAKSVADCALLDKVLAAETGPFPQPARMGGLRFAVPKTVFQADLSADVAASFAKALSRLSAAGARIVELPMAEFAQAAAVNPRGAITATEAYAWHRQYIKEGADKYDRRVISRIRNGEKVLAADYLDVLRLRGQFVRTISAAASEYDALGVFPAPGFSRGCRIEAGTESLPAVNLKPRRARRQQRGGVTGGREPHPYKRSGRSPRSATKKKRAPSPGISSIQVPRTRRGFQT